MAKTYILRDIPEALWDEAKHEAINRKQSLKDLVLDAIRKTLAESYGGSGIKGGLK
jgi:hypothetical protein